MERYYLMHKNIKVAAFEISDERVERQEINSRVIEHLPVYYRDNIQKWLNNRTIPADRIGIRAELGFSSRMEYLLANLALSLADSTVKATDELKSLLGDSSDVAMVSLLGDRSYLDTDSKSLNEATFNSSITRAEAIYGIVKTYYSDEYDAVDTSTKNDCYSDCKNAGNLAEEAGTSEKEQYKLANLSYMLQHPNKGLDEELYKAMVVAYNHGLLGSVKESNWDETLTKKEALEILLNVYNDIGTTVNCKQGNTESAASSGSGSEDKLLSAEEAAEEYVKEVTGAEPVYSYADFIVKYADIVNEWVAAGEYSDTYEYYKCTVGDAMPSSAEDVDSEMQFLIDCSAEVERIASESTENSADSNTSTSSTSNELQTSASSSENNVTSTSNNDVSYSNELQTSDDSPKINTSDLTGEATLSEDVSRETSDPLPNIDPLNGQYSFGEAD